MLLENLTQTIGSLVLPSHIRVPKPPKATSICPCHLHRTFTLRHAQRVDRRNQLALPRPLEFLHHFCSATTIIGRMFDENFRFLMNGNDVCKRVDGGHARVADVRPRSLKRSRYCGTAHLRFSKLCARCTQSPSAFIWRRSRSSLPGRKRIAFLAPIKVCSPV